MKTARTKAEVYQDLLNEFIELKGGGQVDLDEMFEWATREQKWQPQKTDLRKQFKAAVADAARAETYTDPQGREVRRKHAIRIKEGEKQLVLWADIEDAPPDHMHLSLQQRRRGILGEVVQLNTDKDSYNDNNKHGGHIDLYFNFEEDLAEGRHPTDYPDEPPNESGE